MNNRPLRPMLPPIMIGAISALGLCLIATYVWSLSRASAQAVPTETATPFTYMLLSTETPIVTETPPTEEIVLPIIPTTSNGIDLGTFSTTEVAGVTAMPDAVDLKTVTPDSRTCTPASAEFLDAVLLAVTSMNVSNKITSAWMVESNDLVQLTFVSARIRQTDSSPQSTLPGVWGLFVYDEGGFDIYAINNIAQENSYAALGSDFLPAITMDTDGAQFTYDCALSEP